MSRDHFADDCLWTNAAGRRMRGRDAVDAEGRPTDGPGAGAVYVFARRGGDWRIVVGQNTVVAA